MILGASSRAEVDDAARTANLRLYDFGSEGLLVCGHREFLPLHGAERIKRNTRYIVIGCFGEHREAFSFFRLVSARPIFPSTSELGRLRFLARS